LKLNPLFLKKGVRQRLEKQKANAQLAAAELLQVRMWLNISYRRLNQIHVFKIIIGQEDSQERVIHF
jgi:hypothetical protein